MKRKIPSYRAHITLHDDKNWSADSVTRIGESWKRLSLFEDCLFDEEKLFTRTLFIQMKNNRRDIIRSWFPRSHSTTNIASPIKIRMTIAWFRCCRQHVWKFCVIGMLKSIGGSNYDLREVTSWKPLWFCYSKKNCITVKDKIALRPDMRQDQNRKMSQIFHKMPESTIFIASSFGGITHVTEEEWLETFTPKTIVIQLYFWARTIDFHFWSDLM